MSYQVRGSDLSKAERVRALAMFVHRYTRDHKPAWANKPRPDGTSYKAQFASDADWLAHTMFTVTPDGRISTRAQYCESSPTWPEGR